jgi:hypothetical protein
MIIKRPEVEVELPDQVRLRTTKSPCPNTWVNDQRIKVLLKARSVKQTISDPTIIPSKTTIFPILQPKLLFTFEVKDKVKLDLKVVNDPERIKMRIKVRNKGRKMYSASKVKCRNDERMRYPHPLRKLRWNSHNNKTKRMSLNLMLSQRYLSPLSQLMELMLD